MLDQENELLNISLSAAVPIWIEQLRVASPEYRTQRAQEAAKIVAGEGDNILFKGPKQGDSARAFNALAEGLACLAFAPGGVKFAGMHFQADPEKA